VAEQKQEASELIQLIVTHTHSSPGMSTRLVAARADSALNSTKTHDMESPSKGRLNDKMISMIDLVKEIENS